MKRFAALLMLFLLSGFLATAQTPKRNGNRNQKAVNQPPKINSFTPSFSLIALCPRSSTGYCSPDGSRILLSTEASDPEGDSLTYKYWITGGRITGAGQSIIWDLDGLTPGIYEAKVEVRDRRGGLSVQTTTVTLELCDTCHFSCPEVTVLYPNAVDEGQSIGFSAYVVGGDQTKGLSYKWTVSAGIIIKGQGTHTIEVDTAGLAGQEVKATVEIDEIAPECQRTQSGTTQIRKGR